MGVPGRGKEFVLIRVLMLGMLLGVAALCSAVADPFDAAVADIGLLQIKAIQTELKVSTAQRNKMNTYAEAHRRALAAYEAEVTKSKTDPQKAMASPKFKKIFDDLKNGVISQLSIYQLKRLRELTLQRAGIVAIGQDSIAKRVGLTAAQTKKYRTIFEGEYKKAETLKAAAVKAALKPYEGRKPKDEAEAKKLNAEVQKKLEAVQKGLAPKLAAMAKATEAKLLAVLTAVQKKSWAALLGKPYTG